VPIHGTIKINKIG